MDIKKGTKIDDSKVVYRVIDDVKDFAQGLMDRRQFNGMSLLDREGNSLVLVNVKGINENLNNQIAQTGRYFQYDESYKIAILTNMVDMYFFSDFQTPGVMDEEPFNKINLETYTQQDIDFLELFQRDYFFDHFDELYAKWKHRYTL